MDKAMAWYQGWPVVIEKVGTAASGWYGPPKGSHGKGSQGGVDLGVFKPIEDKGWAKVTVHPPASPFPHTRTFSTESVPFTQGGVKYGVRLDGQVTRGKSKLRQLFVTVATGGKDIASIPRYKPFKVPTKQGSVRVAKAYLRKALK